MIAPLVLRVPERTSLRQAALISVLLVSVPPALGPAGGPAAVLIAAAALSLAVVQLRRGGTTLDAEGIRPAGWLFRKIVWSRLRAVGADTGLVSSGETFLLLHDRRAAVALPRTTRADVVVIEDYHRRVLADTP